MPKRPQDPGGDHARASPGTRRPLGPAAAQELAGVAGDALDLLRVPGQEGVVVDDLDLGLEQRLPQVGGHEVALAVVVVVPLGVQHAEPVADRDARRDHQEPLGEPGVLRRHDLVDRLPGDQHRHHDRLAGAGRHLQRDARQPVVVESVLRLEPPAVVGRAVAAGDLGEEDRRLGRLALAEQHRLVAVCGSAAQCASSLRVYGVTPFQLLARQRSTSRRMSLISEFCSRRSPVTSKSSVACERVRLALLVAGPG